MIFNKKILLAAAGVIFAAILFNWALHNGAAAAASLSYLSGLLAPFVLGGVIAFIMNVPMRAIELRLFPQNPKLQKLRRPLAWLLTLLTLMMVILLVVVIVIPQLIQTLRLISEQAMQLVVHARQYLEMMPDKMDAIFPELETTLKDFGVNISSISRQMADMLQNLSGLIVSGVSILNSILNGMVTLFIGFVFSVYLLFGKERLSRQAKRVIYAMCSLSRADKIVEVARLSNRTFSNFITGQCLEACILGILFFICMLLFRLPYATLTSVLVGVTALVPIFGAFIGCICSMLFIALSNPMQALGFLALFLVLQQFEGNIIYPRVVGSSVGLPAIWVLVAITLGGSLFGVMGMLVSVPLCSVAYAVCRSLVNDRLSAKDIPSEKWQN